MISVTDLRANAVFEEEGQLWKVLRYEHVKLGRGTATIKVKIRNLRTGSITERAFISGARVQEANLLKKEVQYLYQDKSDHIFMDPITFEQFTLSKEKLGDEEKFLKEGMNVQVLLNDDEALSIELPIKMEFKIKESDPSVRGNSATNIFKDAVLENGLKLKVPLFVDEGDTIRIDTRTGEYVERVGK